MDKVIEAFKALSIAAVSDAMDRLGIHGACVGIAPVQYGYQMVGRAYTVQYLPVSLEKGTVGDYIDEVKAGEVVVLDNAGRLDCTVWGDILTSVSHINGIAGTVIHGVCRDVKCSLELKYPIFSRGKFMRTGKDRVDAVAFQVPVSLGDVQVRPGDIVYGSDDGVLVIPQEKEAEILAVAQMIEEKEEGIRAEVLKGTPLKEAREKYGYHQLQTKTVS
ncbi:RraA family protein [Brevibacillus nitrificans]|uniref:RraA family protein n=2 Tax=Brevibacillus nitrificans TaxID=651560 RepID=UPI002638DD44|nr:RraA family protein [Brevibacillus nitrificans]MED1796722.1 RraA family protein [Brevibacillus nitrificans]